MEICSRAGRTAMRCLCNLLLRALATKIFASSTCSLMKTLLDELVRPSLVAAAPIAGSELPWLPQDILMDIFALLEIPDLVRAGSVCASWRAACTSLCATEHRCKLQQTPCLLYTSESLGDKAMGLYSLAEKKAYTLTLPDPPIRIAWVSISGNASILDLGELRDFLFNKAFLSSDPSTGDYFVVLIHNPHAQLSFARAGDEEWTWLPPHTSYEDCQFQGALLYATTNSGEIHAFDLGAPAVEAKIVLNRVKYSMSDRIYIVQAPSGELLQIRRSTRVEEHEDASVLEGSVLPEKTTKIEVHKVDLTSEKFLVKIDSLGENVLFIGRNYSLCLCAKEYPQLKPNHAYFTDDDDLSVTHFKNLRRDIGEFDLENNRNMEIVSPQLWSNSPTPVWLVPNPRRMSLASHN
ncbi:putative F-box protein [Panicum miliaceum]|uniref:F-box protein n=1 Tax=Panicum miliaceum TaxID=4540 RepID=A0A3L6PHV1_PANMI|nr:putative F-box protein [Panicum miliaceum]